MEQSRRDPIKARSCKLILEATDPATECTVQEAKFEVDTVSELCNMIGIDQRELEHGGEYLLNPEEVSLITKRFNVDFFPGSMCTRLRSRSALDDLPYQVHTGRELKLMLEGTKPLAYFYEEYPASSKSKDIPEDLFDQHVAAGRFVKREHVLIDKASERHSKRVVLYALPGQEWRIEAFLLLLDTAAKTGWNPGFERMEGSLLGYEEWQNDIFMEQIYAARERTGSK